MSTALITGITGQDGSYLTELLLGKGYQVHGLVWPPVAIRDSWLAQLEAHCGTRLFLQTGDIRETGLFDRLISEAKPDEVYHLAGHTHVLESFADPEAALDLNARATVRLLEAARQASKSPKIFHASSAEIFGSPAHSPQDESTAVCPEHPYACAKAFSTHMLGVYRQRYGLFAVNGILFPHESPRRGRQFVTRQVCEAAAEIKLGRPRELLLGDLVAQRDWGDARDYVYGMWLALQHSVPEDFVFATGELHSVAELVETAFAAVGQDWRRYVRPDPNYLRPLDARRMVGSAAKAKRLLGWQPRTSFLQLVQEMVRVELERAQARK